MRYLRKIKSCFSLLLVVSLVLLSFEGCGTPKATQENSSQIEVSNVANVNNNINDIDINDAFVELNISPVAVIPLNTVAINVEEIIVNPANVKSIENIEVEVIPINDEFITVAHENFVSYYGEDIDLRKLFVDAAIGTSAVLIMVTLTTVSGGTATFFGAVLVSEMSKAAVIIGAAVDAAVSGYKAYQEGGDAAYIIGHMINGVVDGFKWSALLAPLTGAVSGIRALKAVKYLKKVPGLDKLDDKSAHLLIKNLSKIIKGAPKEITDDALKKAYKSLAKEVTEEVSEEIFIQVLKNESVIVSIIQKTDAFGAARGVRQALQERFWVRAGITEEIGKNIIKGIKQNTLKSLDDIADDAVKKYINQNMYEFVEYFGSSLSKDFIDSCLKKSLGENAYQAVKESITSEKGYLELINKLGILEADNILNNSSNLIMLQKRFGADNLSKIRSCRAIFNQLNNGGGDSKIDVVKSVMDALFDGKIDNIAAIEKIDKNIALNFTASRDLISTTLKDMGLAKKAGSVLDDLSIKGLGYANIQSEIAGRLVVEGMTKKKIVEELGQSVYDSLLKEPELVIQSLGLKAKINSILIEEITEDSLRASKISDDIIKQFLKGDSIDAVEQLTSEQLKDVGNIIAEYYRYNDWASYINFNKQIAEARGGNIKDFLKVYQMDNTIINYRYAGNYMVPTGENANYIKAKYGNIYMSESGFPVFDDYAIARVKIKDLTGFQDKDIVKANKIHHGTSESIKGYTWHHLEDGETLILIPTELHDAYRHTGGGDLIREGLKEAA